MGWGLGAGPRLRRGVAKELSCRRAPTCRRHRLLLVGKRAPPRRHRRRHAHLVQRRARRLLRRARRRRLRCQRNIALARRRRVHGRSRPRAFQPLHVRARLGAGGRRVRRVAGCRGSQGAEGRRVQRVAGCRGSQARPREEDARWAGLQLERALFNPWLATASYAAACRNGTSGTSGAVHRLGSQPGAGRASPRRPGQRVAALPGCRIKQDGLLHAARLRGLLSRRLEGRPQPSAAAAAHQPPQPARLAPRLHRRLRLRRLGLRLG